MWKKQWRLLYGKGNRYAVLNVKGKNMARDAFNRRVVFHRLTKSDKTACNGTDVMGDECMTGKPKGVSPCKRCFANGKVAE